MILKNKCVLILATVIALCSCSDHITDTIDEAFDKYNNGLKTAGYVLIRDLANVNISDLSIYDQANVGLAALFFGVECKDISLGKKGYNIAINALRQDPDECDMMLKYESYFDTPDNYASTVRQLYDELKDLMLQDELIGKWKTVYNNYLYGESQNFNETLTLNSDMTLEEYTLITVKFVTGNYKVVCQAESNINGKWTLEDGILSLRYNRKTLKVDIIPESFDLSFTENSLYSGHFFDSVFDVALGEDNRIKEETKNNLYEALDEYYQDNERSAQVSLEDNEMILRTFTSTMTYDRIK